jgi:hypothetical protein
MFILSGYSKTKDIKGEVVLVGTTVYQPFASGFLIGNVIL